jgi:hypothetical protein
MIFVIWTVSGHVGTAEASLRLNPNLSAGKGLVPQWGRMFAYHSFAILALRCEPIEGSAPTFY